MSVEAPILGREKELARTTKKHSVWFAGNDVGDLVRESVILQPSPQDSFYKQTCFIGFKLPTSEFNPHPLKFFWWGNAPNNPEKLKEYILRLGQDFDVLAAIGPAVDRLKTYRKKRASVIRRENGQNVVGIYLEEKNRLRVGSLPRP